MEIGIWGDSITYGERDSEALGWVGRLRKSFSLEQEISVYNRGICGDTTADVLKRFAVEAAALEPDVIFFAVGINDSKIPQGSGSNAVPLEQFRANLSELVRLANTYTRRLYLLGLTAVDENAISSSSKFLNSEIEKYDAVVEEIAQNSQAAYIPAFDLLTSADLADGLHPNAQGYQKIFEAVQQAFSY